MALKDLYMNFVAINCISSSTATTLAGGVATNGQIRTGLGILAERAWKIHQVELEDDAYWSGGTDGCSLEVCLSTQSGLSAMPSIGDAGVIQKWNKSLTLWGTTADAHVKQQPEKVMFLPPLLIAALKLNLYVVASADFAGVDAQNFEVRIGFTWEPLQDDEYREVWGTWAEAE